MTAFTHFSQPLGLDIMNIYVSTLIHIQNLKKNIPGIYKVSCWQTQKYSHGYDKSFITQIM